MLGAALAVRQLTCDKTDGNRGLFWILEAGEERKRGMCEGINEVVSEAGG